MSISLFSLSPRRCSSLLFFSWLVRRTGCYQILCVRPQPQAFPPQLRAGTCEFEKLMRWCPVHLTEPARRL